MQILYDLIFFIFDCHGVQLSQLGVLGRGRPSWHEGGRRRVMLPDSDEWRTEVFLRVRPFKDEFRPQTVRISENGRRWINIQNLDPNPDNLIQREFEISPLPIDNSSRGAWWKWVFLIWSFQLMICSVPPQKIRNKINPLDLNDKNCDWSGPLENPNNGLCGACNYRGGLTMFARKVMLRTRHACHIQNKRD